MSARDELFEIVMRDRASSGGDAAWTNDLLDAFTKEVREEAIKEMAELLKEMPLPLKVEERPLWYKLGWEHGRRDASEFILTRGLDEREG